MKKILFIIASFRKNSFNRKVSEFVREEIKDKAQIIDTDYRDLPMFNQDTEFDFNPEVNSIREAFESADAIWIFSPEYNGSYPGSLKNMLDWISRPLEKGGESYPPLMKNKKVTVTSAGGHSGERCRDKLTELMKRLRMNLMEETFGIKVPAESFITDEFSLTDEDKENLKRQVKMFLSFIEEDNLESK